MYDKKFKFIAILGLILTIIGFITGKFFFLLLLFPFSFGFLKKNN